MRPKAQEIEFKIRKETEEAEMRSCELAEIAKEEENEKARIKAKKRMKELLARRDQEEMKFQTSIETIQDLIACSGQLRWARPITRIHSGKHTF